MSQIKGFLGFLKAGIHYTTELILKLADFLVNGYIEHHTLNDLGPHTNLHRSMCL